MITEAANLVEILRDRADRHPDRPAIIQRRRGLPETVTYRDLDDDVRRTATLLRDRGVGPGDVALMLTPMSRELYAVLLALFQRGASAMFLDPGAGRKHVEACCTIREPRALIASDRAHLLRLRIRALRRIPVKFTIGLPVPGATNIGDAPYFEADDVVETTVPETPALYTFTSGSTGQPKAALRTHDFLRIQHRVLERSLDLRDGQVDLTTLPVFLLANLASGVTSVIPSGDLRRPGNVRAEPILAQIEDHRVERVAASPAFMDRLVDECVRRRRSLSSLRRIDVGGAPVFPRLLDRLARVAPSARLVSVYGSTEAEPIAEIAHEDVTATDLDAMRGGAGLLTGRPIDAIRLRIIKDQWGTPLGPFETEHGAQPVRPGAVGEIIVNGDHVLQGYVDGAGDEETKVRIGGNVWHRTGDAGRLDEDGRLWLQGRCAARVAHGGASIYPFGIECAALQQPAVARAAFIEDKGTRVLAVEAVRGRTIDPEALRATLPVDEVVVMPIPVDRRHNAKVDYPTLRRRIARR